MGFSTASFINRKWMLCTLVSFLGFLLLLCRDQGQRAGPVLLSSLTNLEAPAAIPPRQWKPDVATQVPLIDLAPTPSVVDVVVQGQSIVEFSPQPSVVEEASSLSGSMERVSSKYDKGSLSPHSFEGSLSPQHNIELSPNSHEVEAASMTLNIEMPQQFNKVDNVPPPSNIELHSEFQEKTSSLSNHVDAAAGDLAEGKCDLFDGSWVYDRKSYPLYRAHWCPFLSEQVSCQRNRRPDSDYEHWRWQPRGCKLPSFNGTHMLETLRGKRVVIVGDSLNRNQWESLLCLLYSSSRRSRAFIKTKASDYKIFRDPDYDCTVEFFWSPFLVKLEKTTDGTKVLKLDKLPGSAKRWQGADVMVFNTGHWWTHRGKMRAWDYFEHNGELKGEMDTNVAFETALQTWARWLDQRVDSTKSTVFFRSASPEHKRESQHWCYNQTQPITNETYVQWFPKSMVSIVERTISKMRTPVKYLNITRLSEYRRDGHTAVYTARQGKLLTLDQQRRPEEYADCSHWCLPGLPDTWNVLLYASLIGTPSMGL